jgi:hypothetical protein
MHIRELRSEMELKDLSLREVSNAAGVCYTAASAILSGRLINPTALKKLRTAITAAPMPELQPA